MSRKNPGSLNKDWRKYENNALINAQWCNRKDFSFIFFLLFKIFKTECCHKRNKIHLCTKMLKKVKL